MILKTFFLNKKYLSSSVKAYFSHKKAAFAIDYVMMALLIGMPLFGTFGYLQSQLHDRVCKFNTNVNDAGSSGGGIGSVPAGCSSGFYSLNEYESVGQSHYGLHQNANGQTAFPGWNVTSGTIDLVGKEHSPNAPFNRFIDLGGWSPGAIGRQIPTVPGQSYTVSFQYAANNSVDGGKRSAVVSAAGTSVEFSSQSNSSWQTGTITFTATSNSTDLSFATSFTSDPRQGLLVGGMQIKAN